MTDVVTDAEAKRMLEVIEGTYVVADPDAKLTEEHFNWRLGRVVIRLLRDRERAHELIRMLELCQRTHYVHFDKDGDAICETCNIPQEARRYLDAARKKDERI